MFYLLLLALPASLPAQTDMAGTRERIRYAFSKLMSSEKAAEDFLFERHSEKKELSIDGQVKSATTLTFRRDPWEEHIVTRLILRNGHPLPDAEKARQEEQLRKSIESYRRGKPIPTAKSPFAEGSWMEELPDALEFRPCGPELRDGMTLDVLEFFPRPGYQAKSMRAKAFERIRGKVWIDRQENELAKLDVDVFDTVSIGFGILGRIEKGTRFELERKKWAPNLWFHVWQRARFDAKIMLVKTIRQEIESRWSNFVPYNYIPKK